MRTHYCQLAHTSKQMKSAYTQRTNTIKTLKQNIIDSCTNLNKSKHTLTSSVQKECRQTRMIRINPTRLKHKETSTPPSTSSRKHESVFDDENKNKNIRITHRLMKTPLPQRSRSLPQSKKSAGSKNYQNESNNAAKHKL